MSTSVAVMAAAASLRFRALRQARTPSILNATIDIVEVTAIAFACLLVRPLDAWLVGGKDVVFDLDDVDGRDDCWTVVVYAVTFASVSL